MDAEQVNLGSSDKFWRFITERRKQKTVSRQQFEKLISEKTALARKGSAR
jgi:phosphotransacetylase